MKQADFWTLVIIFMIIWTILVSIIFGLLTEKNIKKIEEKYHLKTELPQFKAFDKVAEKYICMKCILNPSCYYEYER